jgi:sigma-E factor negative regulatory protein RseB
VSPARRLALPVLLVASVGAISFLLVSTRTDGGGRESPIRVPTRADTRIAPAPAGSSGAATTAVRAAATHRLVLACRASAALAYVGVQQVRISSGGYQRSGSVEVAHRPGSGVRLTVRSAGNAPGSTYVEQSIAPSLLPGVDDGTLAKIASRYDLRGPRPGEQVAGRSTDVVELVRTAGSARGAVAARFWLDRRTSLPLRREVLDGTGRVQQESAFLSVQFMQPRQVRFTSTLTRPAPDDGQGVSPTALDGLRRAGWLAPAGLPQDFDLVDARMHEAPSASGNGGAASAPVLQLSYTDGVAVVSLFEQRGRLDPRPLAGWSRQDRQGGTVWMDRNVPERVVWTSHGSTYTLVSDDPDVATTALAALPAPESTSASAPGVVPRLRRGAERMFSWIDPFN